MTANAMRVTRRTVPAQEPEWAVWLLVIVMLAVGLLVRWVLESRTVLLDEKGVSLRYPAGWSQLAVEGAFDVAAVGESFETTLFPTSVRIRQLPVTEISTSAQTLGDLAIKWTNQQKDELLAYRVLGIQPVKVKGTDAVLIDYAYVTDPLLGAANVPPIVARGDDVLLRNGDTVTIATFLASDGVYDSQAGARERILNSLQVK